MTNANVLVPRPINEPVKSYTPKTPERAGLKEKLRELRSVEVEIPLIIGGKEIKTGDCGTCIMPHNHQHVLAKYHRAGENEVNLAIDSALESWKSWSTTPWESRVAVFERMATLLSGPYRHLVNASTMLNLSKSVYQAEIDSACELIDLFNFNAWYARQIYEEQPLYSPHPTRNTLEHRPLEGFVFAVTPFNFVSIAGNLPGAPALMGNVVLWKPSRNAVYPAYYLMQLFREAGLPDGVINFIPGPSSQIGEIAMTHERLAGIHFTGSTDTFQNMWQIVGENIANYRTYPRLVGETGGKNFCLVHETADMDTVVAAMVRGAFEYQGQKCSAISRAYIPSSIWKTFRDRFVAEVESIETGDVEEFANFMNALIDKRAFEKVASYIEWAKNSSDVEFITGGKYDHTTGFFVDPTSLVTTDPLSRLMQEEIFGPVLTLYVFEPGKWEETLELINNTSPYGLTGCILADDRDTITGASKFLTHAAGNFYINDKPTGAVVGQQPFGGSRRSGTNDKAGSTLNLLRWITQRTIKENFDPPKDYRYPFMSKK